MRNSVILITMKKAAVFLMLILILIEETRAKGVCILKMVDGKLQKYGDCDDKQQSQVLKSLDNKLEKLKKTKSCKDVKKSDAKISNKTGGVFDIYPESIRSKVEVYCDLETDGGGWTVFQRRMDGSQDFYLGWDDYVKGFGRKDKEFWLGLENIYQMTKNGDYELRVQLQNFNGNQAYANYGHFSISSAFDEYRINISSYSGNAGDSLAFHNGVQFSANDNDNDRSGGNCAVSRKGAWWYKNCHVSNLNGKYYSSAGIGTDGVVWYHWKNSHRYLKFAEMKFRKKN